MPKKAIYIALIAVAYLLAIASLVSADAAPAAEVAGTLSLKGMRWRVVELVNAARAKVGCRPLRSDSRLTFSAQRHSEHMALTARLTHQDPRGGLLTRMRRAGYGARAAGENVAVGYNSPEEVVMAWLRSPGHRRNILNCAYRNIGVGVIYGFDQRLYWTQQFAAP